MTNIEVKEVEVKEENFVELTKELKENEELSHLSFVEMSNGKGEE